MKNSWQLKVLFIGLIITYCSGGPISAKTNDTVSSNEISENKDLSDNSKNSEGPTAENSILTSDTPKLNEANAKLPEPANVSTKSASNNVILNYNIGGKASSTTASNKVVNEVASGTVDASVSVAAADPPESAPAEPTASDTVEEQVKTEENIKPEAVIENVEKATNDTVKVSDNTRVESEETKADGSIDANEADESNSTTKDEKEQNETVSETENVTTNKPVSEKNPVTEAKSVLNTDSESNAAQTGNKEQSQTSDSNIQTAEKEQSVTSDSNTQTADKVQSVNSDSNTETADNGQSVNSDSNTETADNGQSVSSDSNTQTDNQDPSADSDNKATTDDQEPNPGYAIKTPKVVSETTSEKVVASKLSTTTTPASKTTTTPTSSFNVYFGDSSASYPQSPDTDYSQYNGDDENEPSYNVISEGSVSYEGSVTYEGSGTYDYDYSTMEQMGNENVYNEINADALNSVDTASNDNERGTYKHEQQKLNGEFTDDTDSHFFAYFLTVMVTAIVFYLLFHNKQRIIALIIEGRSSPRSRRSSSGRTRYHKLDNNLEEAMGQTNKGSTRFDGLY
ncbi:unnamed protein product [Meganyctiphanes norvegica]|uniref:Trans-Golgi network integral membrane protein 2 n=1 Tax=Meganyctiphanes norvegica TaxID=48144 RepID=A0AAV2PHH8_MEGNR